jgi:hypothetical protein
METLTLVKLAESYGQHMSLKLSTVSTYASGDGKKFGYWKGGGGCTVKTAATVLQWFSDNWPDDLTWPKDIARPSRGTRRAA